MLFFFFKQKTAYEIKECDWSSDVCSSDLEGPPATGGDRLALVANVGANSKGPLLAQRSTLYRDRKSVV